MSRIWVGEIAEGLTLLRVDDDRVKSFEAIWDVPEGITYNAYLLKTDGKTILFDGWKREYGSEFIDTLKGLTRIEDIDYIVLHHTEPDHSGTLPEVLELNGYRAKVFGHSVAKRLVNEFYGIGDKMDFHPVEDGEELKLGSKTLKFLHTPWLHWPDTICTYIVEDKILFTGDTFGGFSMPDKLFDDSDVDRYMYPAKKYMVNVIGHYKEHVPKNIDKLSDMKIEIRMIAPLHGLIWKNDPYKIIRYYRDIAEGKAKKGKVLVVYNSMYGFVEGAMDHILESFPEAKVFKFTDMQQDSISDALAEVPDSEAIILGVSTYEAGAFPMMEFFARQLAHKADYKKPVLIVSSYGWGSAAVKVLKSILSETEFEIRDVVEYRGRADEAIFQEIDKSLGKLSMG